MAEQGIVKVLNNQGERVRAIVYRESPDGSTHNGQPRLDLLIPTVDSQNRHVDWFAADKCRHGVEFFYLDEDDSALGKAETEHFNRGLDTGEVTQDVSEGQGDNPVATAQPTLEQETWQRLGFASKQAWKEAGKPQA